MIQNVCPHCECSTLGRDFGKWFCFECDEQFTDLKTIEFEELGQGKFRKLEVRSSYTMGNESNLRKDTTPLTVYYKQMKDFSGYLRA